MEIRGKVNRAKQKARLPFFHQHLLISVVLWRVRCLFFPRLNQARERANNGTFRRSHTTCRIPSYDCICISFSHPVPFFRYNVLSRLDNFPSSSSSSSSSYATVNNRGCCKSSVPLRIVHFRIGRKEEVGRETLDCALWWIWKKRLTSF